MKRFEKLKEKLNDLGFSGDGYDDIEMTEERLAEELGVDFANWNLEEYEDDSMAYMMEFEDDESITVEVFDGMVSEVFIDE